MNLNHQGNLKKRRESGLMTHKVGPKQRKENKKERIQNEISESSSSESSVCKTGHKTTVKRTPAANARVTSKRPLVQKTLMIFGDHEQQPEMLSTVAVVP